ncbi:MAG: prolyl oligopeptidase family serine peptidase [Bacteroidetes bacterium]|nr:prolyl oligopeptidase family serine peptidase [Bacteroidota bacterium]
MLKQILTTFLFLTCLSALAQNGKIVSKTLINLQKDPLWKMITVNDTLIDRYKHVSDVLLYEIVYMSDSLEIKGYISEPKKPGKYPVIIFNRGGNRDFSTMNPLLMIVYTSSLVANGYVVLASQYREALGAGGKDEFGGAEVNDILNLTITVRQLENTDPERMGLFGWSRGGMMTWLTLQRDHQFKTAVVGNGVSDLLKRVPERPDMETNVYAECIPNYWENKEAELKKRSVIYWADELPKSTSLLIVCGSNDERVNPGNSRNLAEKLKELNYDFEFHEFETDHRFRGKRDDLNVLLVEWFNRKLK